MLTIYSGFTVRSHYIWGVTLTKYSTRDYWWQMLRSSETVVLSDDSPTIYEEIGNFKVSVWHSLGSKRLNFTQASKI